MKKNKKRSVGRPVSNIPVPEETLNSWLANYQVGDFTELSEKKKIGRPTIRNAFRGISSQAVIEKITDFYNDRKKGKTVIHEKIKLAKM